MTRLLCAAEIFGAMLQLAGLIIVLIGTLQMRQLIDGDDFLSRQAAKIAATRSDTITLAKRKLDRIRPEPVDLEKKHFSDDDTQVVEMPLMDVSPTLPGPAVAPTPERNELAERIDKIERQIERLAGRAGRGEAVDEQARSSIDDLSDDVTTIADKINEKFDGDLATILTGTAFSFAGLFLSTVHNLFAG